MAKIFKQIDWFLKTYNCIRKQQYSVKEPTKLYMAKCSFLWIGQQSNTWTLFSDWMIEVSQSLIIQQSLIVLHHKLCLLLTIVSFDKSYWSNSASPAARGLESNNRFSKPKHNTCTLNSDQITTC